MMCGFCGIDGVFKMTTPNVRIHLALAFVWACIWGMGGCAGDRSGILVVYAAGPRSLADFACATFRQATGHKIELFCGTTGQIMARLEAEKYRPRADVVLLAGRTGAEALKDAGALMPFLPENAARLRSEWNDPQGCYYGTGAAVVGIATHRGSVPEAIEWADILEGRFRGRSIMPSPSRSGSSSEYVLAAYQQDPDGFWATFTGARRRGLEITGANNQALTSLLIGSHQAVFAAADYLVFPSIAAGEPIVMQFPASGCPYIVRPIMILKTTGQPDLARRFVEHVLGSEVQREVSEAYLLPALASVPLHPLRAASGNPKPMPFDVAEGLAEQGPVLRRFQYEIERAVIPPP
jgi:iron(III) transport system substrate-binding protein